MPLFYVLHFENLICIVQNLLGNIFKMDNNCCNWFKSFTYFFTHIPKIIKKLKKSVNLLSKSTASNSSKSDFNQRFKF